ncbi:MAG: glycosyltransferase family 25 protein [Psittacicella sp.]
MVCTLNHQKIYRKIIEENIEHALILEDNVYLPKNKLLIYKTFEDIIKNENRAFPNCYLFTMNGSYYTDKEQFIHVKFAGIQHILFSIDFNLSTVKRASSLIRDILTGLLSVNIDKGEENKKIFLDNNLFPNHPIFNPEI